MKDNKQEKDMKGLTLIIKAKYLEAILSGRKVQEFREIRPTNERKYVLLDEKGYAILDENQNCIPIKYDAIRFYVGYGKERDTALVEVLSAYTEILVDDNNKPIVYEYESEDYWAERVVYNLGKILDHNIREQSKRV